MGLSRNPNHTYHQDSIFTNICEENGESMFDNYDSTEGKSRSRSIDKSLAQVSIQKQILHFRKPSKEVNRIEISKALETMRKA